MTGRYETAWFVYRLHGDGGDLYVGMTKVFSLRMQNHYASDYGHRIVNVTTERFASHDAASRREAELIAQLRPELNTVGVPPPDDTEPHAGACHRCGDPVPDTRYSACDGCVAVAFQRYVTDASENMRTLGDELGLSRERVRQRFDDLAGGRGLALLLRRATRNEAAVLAAEVLVQRDVVTAEREGVTCATCGRSHARRYNRGWARSCSPECRQMWAEVRYLVEDHDVHLRRAASWVVRHPDRVNETMLRVSANRMVGVEPGYDGAWASRPRRYLTEGSRRWAIAVRAYRERWPAFETWPAEIQQQVREHLDVAA